VTLSCLTRVGKEDAAREGGDSSNGPTSATVDDKRGSVDESTIEGLENIRGSLHLSQSDVEEPSAPLTLSPREEFYMGWLLWRGIKVSQNKKAALRHFRIAAEGGHSGAMFTLGHAYYTGEAVTQDRAKGMKVRVGGREGKQHKAAIEVNHICNQH
jgi:TPR repeat protein